MRSHNNVCNNAGIVAERESIRTNAPRCQFVCTFTFRMQVSDTWHARLTWTDHRNRCWDNYSGLYLSFYDQLKCIIVGDCTVSTSGCTPDLNSNIQRKQTELRALTLSKCATHGRGKIVGTGKTAKILRGVKLLLLFLLSLACRENFTRVSPALYISALYLPPLFVCILFSIWCHIKEKIVILSGTVYFDFNPNK